MSRIFETIRNAELLRRGTQAVGAQRGRDAALVTLTSTKGGVGRTVLAPNLAVDLGSLAPDRPDCCWASTTTRSSRGCCRPPLRERSAS